MLKYLIIQLDDSATSFCHYESNRLARLIDLADLKAGIIFGMKQNLMIQFLYPDFELPAEYKTAVESIDHTKIMPAKNPELGKAGVIVCNSIEDFNALNIFEKPIVLLINKATLFEYGDKILSNFGKMKRLNIVIIDVETFTENDFQTYKSLLDKMVDVVKDCYVNGSAPQLNLLTDRLMLDNMNNCNAGDENITLAPDGKFYICPAFYAQGEDGQCGDLVNGLNIKNKQLLKLDYAPLCRNCDAFQCKRCVYLNAKMTWDINTPSHEQCVAAHLERNASRRLLEEIRKHGVFMPETEIKEIGYLDPFDVRKEW